MEFESVCFPIYIGCDLVFFPAAFHISTGPQYWELVHRARAADNQLFVAAISPARNENATYVVYGHSMVIDPTGKILAQAGTPEEIVFQEIGKSISKLCTSNKLSILKLMTMLNVVSVDLRVAQKIRKELPLFAARRADVHEKYNALINYKL